MYVIFRFAWVAYYIYKHEWLLLEEKQTNYSSFGNQQAVRFYGFRFDEIVLWFQGVCVVVCRKKRVGCSDWNQLEKGVYSQWGDWIDHGPNLYNRDSRYDNNGNRQTKFGGGPCRRQDEYI